MSMTQFTTQTVFYSDEKTAKEIVKRLNEAPGRKLLARYIPKGEESAVRYKEEIDPTTGRIKHDASAHIQIFKNNHFRRLNKGESISLYFPSKNTKETG